MEGTIPNIITINDQLYPLIDGWQDVTLGQFEQLQKLEHKGFLKRFTKRIDQTRREVAFWLKCPVEDMWEASPEDVEALDALIKSRLEVPTVEPITQFGHAGKAWKVVLLISNDLLDTPRKFVQGVIRDAQGQPMNETEMLSLDMLTIMQCQRHAVQVATLVLAGRKAIELTQGEGK